jgi:lipoprotein-releasing system permease protein
LYLFWAHRTKLDLHPIECAQAKSLFRPLAINVGLRYATSRRSFISFVSVVALAGLVLSVGVLLYVQSVVRGFERELEQRILGVAPHIYAVGRSPIEDPSTSLEIVRSIAGVRHATPVVQGFGLVAQRDRIVDVRLKGVDPKEYESIIGQFIAEGSMAELRPQKFGLLLGDGVMKQLDLVVGDEITVVLPDATVTPWGIHPRHKRFHVVGRVRTYSQIDQQAAYMHVNDAQRLFRLGDAFGGIEVRVNEVLAVDGIASKLLRELGQDEYFVSTWFRTQGPIYRAIQVTKGMMFLLFSLLVAVAVFNVVSSLVMVVNERRADIAVLRTIGGRSSLVIGAFVVLGTIISSLGVALGVLLALGLGVLTEELYGWVETKWALDLMDQYFVHRLPVELAAADVVRVSVTALGLSFLATLYPAWRASRLQPAEVLRYE